MTQELKDAAYIGFAVLALGLLGYWQYADWQRNRRIEAILAGPVRGNAESRIFHVPTCPNYAEIAGGNIRLFATVEEAREANFRPALNCLDAIDIRNLNETEEAEPSGAYEDPRQ